MQIKELEAGAKVLLEDGSVAEVIAPSNDGRSVRVKYLEAPFNPALVGTRLYARGGSSVVCVDLSAN